MPPHMTPEAQASFRMLTSGLGWRIGWNDLQRRYLMHIEGFGDAVIVHYLFENEDSMVCLLRELSHRFAGSVAFPWAYDALMVEAKRMGFMPNPFHPIGAPGL